MDNKTKGKYKIYGAIFGFFAIIAAGFAFAVFPIIRGIVYNSDEIQKKIIDNEINQKGIEKIPEMEKVHDLFVQKQNSLELIINEGEEVGFIKKMEGLAEETGNKIEIKIDNTKNVPKKKEEKKKDAGIIDSLPYENYILMEIDLYGNYENLIKFITKLEKFEKYINIVGLDLAKVEIEEEVAEANVFNSVSGNNQVTETKKKELLRSIINLAVYVKK